MNEIISTIKGEFSDLGSLTSMTKIVLRVVMAGILGGIVGYERECRGKAAGFRTQSLVAMGTSFLIIVSTLSGMEPDAVSRVVQGALTGLGFLGAGAILKHTEERRIEGLTTAASIWFTAAIGIATGLGHEGAAILACVMSIITLWVMPHFTKLGQKSESRSDVLVDPTTISNNQPSSDRRNWQARTRV